MRLAVRGARKSRHHESDGFFEGGGAESMAQTYGRQYIIQRDSLSGTYRVTLGKEIIGTHETREGANDLALTHARHVSLRQVARNFDILFHGAEQ